MAAKFECPDTFIARRNFFNFFGIACKLLSMTGSLLFFVKLKAFKLKEDIGVFRDASQKEQVLSIKARRIIDFSAAYDVVDTASGEKVGALKRCGFKSMLRDEWQILDPVDTQIGTIKEDSMLLALLRRFLSNLVPQTYHFAMGNQPAGEVRGTWNPFLIKYTARFRPEVPLDRRLAVAGVVLLMAIEGKQQS